MTREEFCAAFEEAVSREFDFIDDMPDHEFSPKFEKKMNRLIKSFKKRGRPPLKTFHKAALIAAASFVIIITTMTQVKAMREPIINFISTTHENFTLIRFDSNNIADSITCEYQLTNIPDGFILTNYQKSSDSIYTQYKNDAGDTIRLVQNIITPDSKIHLDNERGETKNLTISDVKVLLYTSDFSIMAFWTQDNHNIKLSCIGNFTEEAVVDIIESIKPVESQ